MPATRGAPKKPEPKLTACAPGSKEDEQTFSTHSEISNEVQIQCVWGKSGDLKLASGFVRPDTGVTHITHP